MTAVRHHSWPWSGRRGALERGGRGRSVSVVSSGHAATIRQAPRRGIGYGRVRTLGARAPGHEHRDTIGTILNPATDLVRPTCLAGTRPFPLALGTNVFGWTVGAPTALEVLDVFADDGGRVIDTADVYSAWLPGNSGRRVRGDHRPVARPTRQPRPGRAEHEVRSAPRRPGPVARQHPRGGRGVAAPSAHRPHRSLLHALRRRRDAARRDGRARSASSSTRARSAARPRRTTPARASVRRSRSPTATACTRSRRSRPPTTWCVAPSTSRDVAADRRPLRPRRAAAFVARERVPDGQVPARGRSGRLAPRQPGPQLPHAAEPGHPRGRRRDRRAARRRTGAVAVAWLASRDNVIGALASARTTLGSSRACSTPPGSS